MRLMRGRWPIDPRPLTHLARPVGAGLLVLLLMVSGAPAYRGRPRHTEPAPAATVRESQSATKAPSSASVGVPGLLAPPVSVGVQAAGISATTPTSSQPAPTAGQRYAAGDLWGLANLFDKDEALATVRELASTVYGGRQPGTEAHRAAGDYIAESLAAYGLVPAGTSGFFQPFQVPFARVTEVPMLVVTSSRGVTRGTFTFREDYAYAWGGYLGGGQAEGRVYWVGDGHEADYAGLNVAGGIVLLRYTRDESTLRRAVERGAVGVLLWSSAPVDIDRVRTYRDPPLLAQTLPGLIVSDRVVEALLEGSAPIGEPSFLRYSMVLPGRARFSVAMEEPGWATARNILGLLPGSDPLLADQVLIIGAHYDHLGVDANGDVYYGANDNASGVAVVLEIARSWHAAGYRPAASVLFAAWDAEEQNLLGSSHYVQHPTIPLGRIMGKINLDMVGLATKGLLTIEATAGDLQRQLAISAGLLGLPTRLDAPTFGSDHRPFMRAGVPAGLLTWDGFEVPYYHTPDDAAETIEPERLRQAGVVASHAALSLATTMPQLRALLTRQAAAISAGDVTAYLATLDPDDEALLRDGRDWMARQAPYLRGGFGASATALEVYADAAQAQWTARLFDGETTRTLGTYPLRLVRRGDEWYAARPLRGVFEGERLTFRFVGSALPDVAEAVRTGGLEPEEVAWARSVDAAYTQLARRLQLHEGQPQALNVYPDAASRAFLAPRVSAGGIHEAAQVSRAGTAQADVSSLAAALVLEGLGLPPGAAPWLRIGLAVWEDVYTTSLLAASDATAALRVMAKGSQTFGAAERAVAGSLVRYLIVARGPAAVPSLCALWALGPDDRAWAALALTQEALAADWEREVVTPLRAVDRGVTDSLNARTNALLKGDEVAFLETVDPDDPQLRAAQQTWFASLVVSGVQDARVSGELLHVYGGACDVRIEYLIRLSGGAGLLRGTEEARFRRTPEGWRYAGSLWVTAGRPPVTVRYAPGALTAQDLATVLDAAGRVHAAVNAGPLADTIADFEVRAYADSALLRLAAGPAAPEGATAYRAPGGEMLVVAQMTRDDLVRALVHEVVASTLEARALPAWVIAGLADVELARANPGARQPRDAHLQALREAAARDGLLPWKAYATAPAEADLWRAQAWFYWDRVLAEFGVATARDLLDRLARGAPLDDAFSAATHRPLEQWLRTWEADLLRDRLANEPFATPAY